MDTKRAGKALGVARGLQAHPRSRLPFPPLPGLPDPFLGSFFLLPSGPLRSGSEARSWGLRERREGKREGKGRGGGERRTIPPKAGVEFQLRTLGPNCTPPPGPSPWLLLPEVAVALRVVWSAPSAELASPRHAPALPCQPRASLCLPFISPTSVFPVGGSALLPPCLGPQLSLSFPLALPLQGWQG